METALKYKVIKTREQYDRYCDVLEDLVCNRIESTPEQKAHLEDEMELLTLLIENWDEQHLGWIGSRRQLFDPVRLIEELMFQNRLKNKDLAQILGVSAGLVSDIMNRKKGLSKEIIWKLSDRFKVSPTAFYAMNKKEPQPA